MTQPIEITNRSGRLIGSVSFDESPGQVHAYRTAKGFNLLLPIKISLGSVGEKDLLPMLSNFTCLIYANKSPNEKIEIGRLISDFWLTGARGTGSFDTVQHMNWLGSFAELNFYENLRDGGPVQFDIQFAGELCYLFPLPQSDCMGRTEPQRIRSNTAYITVRYPKEVWVKMLQNLRIAENVLVEVPLPGSPSPDWDEIWQALIDARNAFEQGGSTGWTGCVRSVRLALEKWQGVEKEDKGAGWTRPKQPDLESRTKKQRLDNLRWHLLQVAHLSAHSHNEEWSRDDALLMLSTLSALLAQRKP